MELKKKNVCVYISMLFFLGEKNKHAVDSLTCLFVDYLGFELTEIKH